MSDDGCSPSHRALCRWWMWMGAEEMVWAHLLSLWMMLKPAWTLLLHFPDVHIMAPVSFQCDLGKAWWITAAKSLFGNSGLTHRNHCPVRASPMCMHLSKCLPTVCEEIADRMKHLNRAVGDWGNGLMGVWVPGLVNISREVRRIHSLSSQTQPGFDQPLRPAGRQQAPPAMQRTLTHLELRASVHNS